ncbi:DEAD/DEAH box helicase family protein [Streptomyces sp. I5]|nr:DEAD/DEAH box helicase family protein [Streptomyces sp. I5]
MAGASETSRDHRRAFNSAERVALFLAADGRCTACGQELAPSWHGDHIRPWSGGGPTDVTNGQALCPGCNLKKGQRSMADVFGLREWQQEARERYHSRNGGAGGSFLVVATPGAGKTTFALTIAKDLIDQGVIEKIVVVVPTAHLRRQWSEAANKSGVQLDHRFVNANGVVGRDFDGVVVTYQTVASEQALWRKLCSMRRTLVIFDEIHHAGEGDEQRWGPALKAAFDDATRRLLLSGTPFRTDGTPIPFVEYENKRAVPGYNYDYGMALADGGVVRPVVFPAMDGESKWRRAGEMAVTSITLADTDEKTVPPALKAALDPNGEWIPSVLQEADAALTQARIDTPDAGAWSSPSTKARPEPTQRSWNGSRASGQLSLCRMSRTHRRSSRTSRAATVAGSLLCRWWRRVSTSHASRWGCTQPASAPRCSSSRSWAASCACVAMRTKPRLGSSSRPSSRCSATRRPSRKRWMRCSRTRKSGSGRFRRATTATPTVLRLCCLPSKQSARRQRLTTRRSPAASPSLRRRWTTPKP